MIKAEMILDSISPDRIRLTTMALTYPRMMHAELLTHRKFSRSSGSSRAIPSKRLIDMAVTEMVYPIRWGKNQPGMQAADANLSPEEAAEAKGIWEHMAMTCAAGVTRLSELGLHKQWANRPLEWFSNIRVLVTTSDWSNWDELRHHSDAMPEIEYLAREIITCRNTSTPHLLKPGQWHTPFITPEDGYLDQPTRLMVSSARCARISYLNHDNTNPSVEKDVGLFFRLVGNRPIHASPTEHQATPDKKVLGRWWKERKYHGNFDGWVQFRKKYIETGKARSWVENV